MVVLLLISGIHFSANAQKRGFQPGYIITHNGDTLQGVLKDRSQEPFVTIYNKIRFKPQGKSRTKKYSPEDIRGYGIQDRHFISLPLREDSAFFKFRYSLDASVPNSFLRVIAQSDTLWHLEQEFIHDDNNYVDSFPLFYKPTTGQVVRVTQGFLGFRKKRLTSFFADCPEIPEALYQKDPRLKTVSELYSFYVSNCGVHNP